MIALRRPFTTLAFTAALLTAPSFGQDAQSTFQEGVKALRAGNQEEALASFHAVLAMDLSNRDAYELWQSTESQIFHRMMTFGGESELVAKRFMDLASMGRKERQNDADGIKIAVREALSDSLETRMGGVRRLAADYGEYAVPSLLHALADQSNGDRAVLAMRALTQMGDDVVLPLLASFGSEDARLRRNVALTLGYIGDSRACAALADRAANDSDVGVRDASSKSLAGLGGDTDVLGQYLTLGDAYYSESSTVLMPHRYSNVLWNWTADGLSSMGVPRFLYADELAKQAYQSALDVDPNSQHAIAGIARCVLAGNERLAAWEALGEDAGDWGARLMSDAVAVQLVGADALEVALGWALGAGDQVAASGLCSALGRAATSATPNLEAALTSSSSGAVRGEAAVALAQIAQRNGTQVSAATIAALTDFAGRTVSRIAVVIDADSARRQSLAKALDSRGVFVNQWDTGAGGLVAIRQVPGVDVVVIADRLPDLTLSQVVYDLRHDPRTASTPIVVINASGDGDFGDAVNATIKGVGDLAVIEGAMSEEMNRDRQMSNRLAARSAAALGHLAASGTDVSSAADVLAGSLSNRPDEVLAPMLRTLGRIGTAANAGAVAAVLNAGGSEEIRVAAANSLAGIFSRGADAGVGLLDGLSTIATGDDSMAVRGATARALGHLNLSSEMRAKLIRGLRAQ